MANHFCALPHELQIEILANLDAGSIICCAMTCTATYKAFKNSPLLTYTIQLHLDGLNDAGTALSHSVLIESLVKRRQAWLALELKDPLTRMHPDCELYELAGSAFAHITSDYFEISWLPTTRDAHGRTLRRPSIGISADEFTMDPTQDLIVFLEDDGTPPSATNTRLIRIHIRSISTNTIHPQARQSPLQVTVIPQGSDSNTVNFAALQIAYNVVALHFRNVEGETRALVWDWTTSEVILDTSISFDPCLPSLAYDFGLLDSTYFYIATEGICGAIRIYMLVRPHTAAAPQAMHLATLHLPPAAPGITIRGILSHAGPIEAHPLPDAPFAVEGEDRLHMFTVQYRSAAQGFRVWDVHFFVHQRVLRKYAGRCAEDARAHVDVPWAAWGPRDTMWTHSFPRRDAAYYRRYIHGQRAAFVKHSVGTGSAAETSHTANVFDFSLAAVLSAQGRLHTPSSSSSPRLGGPAGELLSSSAIRTGDTPIFLEDVETHLPCVVSTLHLAQGFSSCMIYADGIIGVNTSPFGSMALDIYPI